MTNIKIDDTDRRILRELQENAELGITELAARINLSSTPCWRRVQKLQDAGVIRKKVALLDSAKVKLNVSVFVHIKTRNHSHDWFIAFSKKISSYAEVAEFYRMSGEYDYLMRIVVADITAFDNFYKRLVEETPDLSDVTSSFAMEQIKYTTALPI
ncbi:Lrp/AsnC family transcriptional regulator [Neptunomonas japonica]|uniref:Lrp/AsnC family transcriptional regulator n=1 Tax=Neptunomonas japonica JAMM 1380 TaxID=1441457 RepID=A0A7R6SXA0_9GAMM|nr:Lrp/AsnC family transcriptional regulator [Neptunomonas japonica]BBB31291.1 Lrp/AsnC family transcriptional regulator [Neptunomonas japonica JAMM 1380]